MNEIRSYLFWIFDVLLLWTGFTASDGQYQLIAPSTHEAFTSDLEVEYITPQGVSLPNAFVRLVNIQAGKAKEITTQGLDIEHKRGRLVFTCGLVEYPGLFEFQLHMYNGGPILARATTIVSWPKVRLQIPPTYVAQTTAVPLAINSQAKCNPLIRRYSFEIILEYTRTSASGDSREIIYTKNFPNITLSSESVLDAFPCTLIDTTGTFVASLKSNYSANSTIASSNFMTVNWSTAYKVNLFHDTVFPCDSDVPVMYTRPQCAGNKDKIRLFMLRRSISGSIASPVEKTYITERHVDPNQNSVYFSCDLFNMTATGYCFGYVTTSRNGAVTLQNERCLSAHPNSVLPIDGGWSDWSSWSACTVTCGSGTSSRFRMCNNPTPNFGGAFCSGEPIQWKTCGSFCPDSIPLTPLNSPKMIKDCYCGCRLEEQSGEIIASGRCEEISRWLISVPEGQKINLTFIYFDLLKTKQWVKVRNGAHSGADLIADSDGASIFGHVISSANQMLVEFYSESSVPSPEHVSSSDHSGSQFFPLTPTKVIHVYGFIATYYTMNASDVNNFAVSPIVSSEKPSIWESKVTIVGIVLCGLIIITAAAFVIYSRTFKKHRDVKYSMAAQEESPAHVCKSTSMPSSPSHESAHGIEIEHDMEIPLTGGATGSDKRKAITPSSTKSRGSTTSGNGIKKLKSKADIECKGCPRTPQKEYLQLSQVEETQGCDSQDGMSLFRASPLLKNKIPRSPKIHPSPRTKKTLIPSTPKTPVDTKQDMLIRRRLESSNGEPDRVVMGADKTPTNEYPICQVESELITPTTDSLTEPTAKRSKKDKRTKHKDNVQSLEKENKSDIQLKEMEKFDGEIRKEGSGTSDDSTNAIPNSEISAEERTTSFIENSAKPRRPTSLTESYSKMSLASSAGKSSSDASRANDIMIASITSKDDRQNALPKPDGQSPKSPRQEHSKSSTPRSGRSASSKNSKTLSPSRSIHTPSDVIELEYDDYIDDDPLSYFDPDELQRLNWRGVEKVGKTPQCDD